MTPPSHVIPRCWVEIDRDALRHNADIARAQAGCELMAIVKANAYGHGAVEVAEALVDKAALFGVANLQEADALRSAGITLPILLLSPCLPEEHEALLGRGFHVCISSLEEATDWEALGVQHQCKVPVHLVLDTGMGRMGFTENQWNETLFRSLLAMPHLQFEGVCSHLPSPDDDASFTQDQIARFKQGVELARAAGISPTWVHLSNSAGLLGFHETHGLCNIARPGLMLYGFSPLASYQALLRPVLTWKTKVTLVRELPAGHGISYGRTFITTKPTQVATLACGYADGYPRQVSGRDASVLIQGQRCAVLGRITMDQCMVDVTALGDKAQAGDEAVLMGSQGSGSISGFELAEKANTIVWHILTGITARVERLYR
ncbi:alanine racemase [soil metagenome]